jgi:hypothetical protein
LRRFSGITRGAENARKTPERFRGSADSAASTELEAVGGRAL